VKKIGVMLWYWRIFFYRPPVGEKDQKPAMKVERGSPTSSSSLGGVKDGRTSGYRVKFIDRIHRTFLSIALYLK